MNSSGTQVDPSRFEEIRELLKDSRVLRAAQRLSDLARDVGTQEHQNRAIRLIRSQRVVVSARIGAELSRKEEDEREDGITEKLLGVLNELEQVNRVRVKTPSKPGRVQQGAICVYRCADMCKKYPGFQLAGVNLELRVGKITGVVGENGSGKTTLLEIIAGERACTVGALSYRTRADESVVRWSDRRRMVGFVRQRPERWGGRLVEMLRLSAACAGYLRDDNDLQVDYYMERLGLGAHRDTRWGELSGGFRARAELAKVMVAGPTLLVLDEPLAALDLHARRSFLSDLVDIAGSARRPVAVILTSQHVPEVEAVADEIVVLRSGAVAFRGSPAELGHDRLEECFEVEAVGIRELAGHRIGPGRILSVPGSRDCVSVKCPLNTPVLEAVQPIAARGANLRALRDVGRSAHRYLRDDGDSA